MRAQVDLERIAFDDVEPSRKMGGDFLQRSHRSAIAFDGDHFLCAVGDERAGQAARAGADFDHRDTFERTRRAGDPPGQVEIEQEILAEGFLGRQFMTADHVSQRRQVVCRAHFAAASSSAGCVVSRAASLSAAIRLDSLALPVPAMSKAVP